MEAYVDCHVDVDVDVDVDADADADVNFEQLEEVFLQIVGTGTRSFSDQFIVSKISVDIELRNR